MALINQKTGDRQGQANNILYPLAAQQFITNSSTTQPNLATCAAYLGTGVLPACYFHDVSGTPNPDPATQQQTPFVTATTSLPCTGSATAAGVFTDASTDATSNYENCYGYQITVTGSGSSLITTPNYYGVLSTADTATAPAFAATPGYDLATGLGTPNVYALVNAPLWSALSITTTSLAPGTVGIGYAQTLAATGRIAPYTWSVTSGSLPSGLSLAPATGVISGTPATAGTSTFTVQVADAESTPVTATASFTLTVATGVPPGFTTTVNPSNLSIEFAGTGTATVTVTPQGGLTGPVNFSCGTLPKFFSCNFAPSSITLNSSGAAVSSTLTINSAAVPATATAAAFWLPAFAGLLAIGRRKRKLALFCVCFAFIAAMSGCGRGDHDAPLGNYSVPVTVSSPGVASQTVTVAVAITVQ
jgi:hypothetical protein